MTEATDYTVTIIMEDGRRHSQGAASVAPCTRELNLVLRPPLGDPCHRSHQRALILRRAATGPPPLAIVRRCHPYQGAPNQFPCCSVSCPRSASDTKPLRLSAAHPCGRHPPAASMLPCWPSHEECPRTGYSGNACEPICGYRHRPADRVSGTPRSDQDARQNGLCSEMSLCTTCPDIPMRLRLCLGSALSLRSPQRFISFKYVGGSA